MNKSFVPLHLIDGLSYGPWDFTIRPFQDWLCVQKHNDVRVLILPTPKNEKERFNLGMASQYIRQEVEKLSLVVVSEARLNRAGLLKKKLEETVEIKSVPFPSPFLVLIVDRKKNELHLVTP